MSMEDSPAQNCKRISVETTGDIMRRFRLRWHNPCTAYMQCKGYADWLEAYSKFMKT